MTVSGYEEIKYRLGNCKPDKENDSQYTQGTS